MGTQRLVEMARHLVSDDKGLLAMDESIPTCNKRFAALGIPQTCELRRAYRELIVSTAGLSSSISGAILCDETIRQQKQDGTPFAKALQDKGIVPGIKVDLGINEFAGHPGEKITDGLDGLRTRLRDYQQMGAQFAKWRAVITIGPNCPSRACLIANCHSLARYAALCQESDIVPIVEPEVLMNGNHTIDRCFEVTEIVLRTLFDQIYDQDVLTEGLLLKPNMVLAGLDCPRQPSTSEVADATIKCLMRSVPASVPGITFLSGGQSSELATERLNAMNSRYRGVVPWQLSFSFARAIQQHAMEIWGGDPANVSLAQRELLYQATCNGSARSGTYDIAVNDDDVQEELNEHRDQLV